MYNLYFYFVAFDFLWTQVNELFSAGDYAGAERASRKAYYWSKVSIIVGVISIVVLIVTSIVLFVVVPIVVGVGLAASAN